MRRPLLLLCTAMLLAGCASPKPHDSVVAQEWPEDTGFTATAITEAGADHALVAGTQLTVTFAKPYELHAYAGCNQLGVQARLEGERLIPYSYLATALACPPELAAQDAWLLRFFEAGPAWQRSGDVVVLHAGETVVTLTATGR